MNYIFDLHQDIADALLYSTHSDFWAANNLHDGWNDLNLPVNNQSDFRRLQQANIRAVFAVVCAFETDDAGAIVPSTNHFYETVKQLNIYYKLQQESKQQISFIRSKQDLQIIPKHPLNFLLAIEGADSVDEDLVYLETFFAMGVRSIGLTWSYDNNLAGGCAEEGELSAIGKRVIERMEQLGIVLDLSHLNEKSYFQALEVSTRPVIVSHGTVRSLYDHYRNLTDEQLVAVTKTGGVVGICGVPQFLASENASIEDVYKHIDYAVNLVGIDNVSIGSDFGAMTNPNLTKGYEQVSDIPALISLLKKNGYKDEDLEKIAYKNILRVLEQILPNE